MAGTGNNRGITISRLRAVVRPGDRSVLDGIVLNLIILNLSGRGTSTRALLCGLSP
jgi:hypothetical protein